ncbi:MAG: hypothetical protein IPP22_06050 [Nitrosomonas sp.]|nr:hypothetical protein [Nitrosomonas sp.]
MPHHNEIAVDEDKRSKEHILYTDKNTYSKQYALRYDAAARHIRKLSRNTGNLDLPLADFVIIDDHVE